MALKMAPVVGPGSYGIIDEDRLGSVVNDGRWLRTPIQGISSDNCFIDGEILRGRSGFDIYASDSGVTHSWRRMFNEPGYGDRAILIGADVSDEALKFLRGTTFTNIGSTIQGTSSFDTQNWVFEPLPGGAATASGSESKWVGASDGKRPLYWDGDHTTKADLLQKQHSDWAATTAYVIGDTVKATSSAHQDYYMYCSTAGTSGGSEPSWSPSHGNTVSDSTVTWTYVEMPKGHAIHQAFGRLWMMDSTNTILYFTGVNEYHHFFGTGRGRLDLKETQGFQGGADTVEAIASFEDFLVLMGSNNILVYNNDPTSFSLKEFINNMGCSSQRSVQNVKTDLIWADTSGLRTFRRNVISTDGRAEIHSPISHIRDYYRAQQCYKGWSAYNPLYELYILSAGEVADGTGNTDDYMIVHLNRPVPGNNLACTWWSSQGCDINGLAWDEEDEIMYGCGDNNTTHIGENEAMVCKENGKGDEFTGSLSYVFETVPFNMGSYSHKHWKHVDVYIESNSQTQETDVFEFNTGRLGSQHKFDIDQAHFHSQAATDSVLEYPERIHVMGTSPWASLKVTLTPTAAETNDFYFQEFHFFYTEGAVK